MPTILDKDIKIKQPLKDIPESNYDKIIFVDDKKLDQKGFLLANVLVKALFDENNPKLFLPMEKTPAGVVRIASEKVLGDLQRIFSSFPLLIPVHHNYSSTINATTLLSKVSPVPVLYQSQVESWTFWYKIVGIEKKTWTDFFMQTIEVGINPMSNNIEHQLIYSFVNKDQNINIHTMRLDNVFFTFIRSDDGSGFKRAKIRNLEVFRFLKEYAGDCSFEVVYPKGETFNLNELPQEVQNQIPASASQLTTWQNATWFGQPEGLAQGKTPEDLKNWWNSSTKKQSDCFEKDYGWRNLDAGNIQKAYDRIKAQEAEIAKQKAEIAEWKKESHSETPTQLSKDLVTIRQTYETKITELEKRPTQDQLGDAVQAEKDRYKDYINPNDPDTTKLLAAAKSAGFGFTQLDIDKAINKEKDNWKGFIDPKNLEQEAKKAGWKYRQEDLDSAVKAEKDNYVDWIDPTKLIEEAEKKGMVTKEVYDARPNATLDQYSTLINNQKPTNLPDNWNQYLEELLVIERKDTKDKLTTFFQQVGAGIDSIKKKFESDANWKQTYNTDKFDYEDIIDKKISLENRADMKRAFKVMACICATEKYKNLSGTITESAKKGFLSLVKKVKGGWNEIKGFPQISEINNPFYLNVIKGWRTYEKDIDELISKYESKSESFQLQPSK